MDIQNPRNLQEKLHQMEVEMKEVQPRYEQLRKEIVFLRYAVDKMASEDH